MEQEMECLNPDCGSKTHYYNAINCPKCGAKTRYAIEKRKNWKFGVWTNGIALAMSFSMTGWIHLSKSIPAEVEVMMWAITILTFIVFEITLHDKD